MNKDEANEVIKQTIEYANNEINKTNTKMRKIVTTVIVVAVCLVAWMAMGVTDYIRVSSFEKPIFCISRASVYNGAEDYRHYQGIGYSFELVINGEESEFPGVARYTYFILGNEVRSGISELTDYANITSGEPALNDRDYYNLTEQGIIKVEGDYADSNPVQSEELWTNSMKIKVKNNSGTDVVVELYSNESDSSSIMEMHLNDKEKKEFTGLSSRYVYSVRVSSESATHISIDISD